MKVLLIRWLDHQSLIGWRYMDEAAQFCAAEPLEAVSVGMLVYEDKVCVVIAQTYSTDDDQCGELLKVMRNCIKSIKTVYTEK